MSAAAPAQQQQAGAAPLAGSPAKEDASPPSMRVSRDDSWGSEDSGGSGQEAVGAPVTLDQVDLVEVEPEGSSQQPGAAATTILDMDELD
jgi:hypothetical protein